MATLFSLHFDVADGGVLLKTFDQYDDSFNYGYLKTANATWSSPSGGGKTFVGDVDNAWIDPHRPLAVSFYTPSDGSFVGGQLRLCVCFVRRVVGRQRRPCDNRCWRRCNGRYALVDGWSNVGCQRRRRHCEPCWW